MHVFAITRFDGPHSQTVATKLGNWANCGRHSSSFFDYVMLIDHWTYDSSDYHKQRFTMKTFPVICFTDEMVLELMPFYKK